MRGIDLLVLAFVSLLLIPSASGASIWKGLLDRPIYYINIDGDATLRNWTPPLNPFNDSSITWINIGYEYNETHTFNKYYEGGKWKEGFFLKHGNPKPFNFSEWNVSKILKEYQWGVENYLPNVSGGHWYKGYWNSTITRWEVTLSANKFKIVLYGGHCGECEQYITLECHRNETNVTCKWGKPVLKVITPPWAPKDTTTSSTTTKTGTIPTTATPTSNKERKLCGPALIVGLALVPVLLRWRLNGGK